MKKMYLTALVQLNSQLIKLIFQALVPRVFIWVKPSCKCSILHIVRAVVWYHTNLCKTRHVYSMSASL